MKCHKPTLDADFLSDVALLLAGRTWSAEDITRMTATDGGGLVSTAADLFAALASLAEVDLGDIAIPSARSAWNSRPMIDPTRATVGSLQPFLESQPTAPTALTAAFLARANQCSHSSHSYISIATDAAMQEADTVQRSVSSGRLAGVPYACKDIFDTTAMPTTAGSRAMEGYRPDRDALAVARLREAGAILLGKTNLHEFCYGITGENAAFGTPVNPHDPTRIAGGSSSGSAVAVAEGSAVFALATDTGGSARVPAALCGLVGLKPTRGLIDTRGVIPFSWSLDHIGVLAKSSADCADVLHVLTAAEEDTSCPAGLTVGHTPFPLSLQDLRIGVPRRHFLENADAEILSAVERTLEHCRSLGAQIVTVETPDMRHVRAASLAIQLVEAFAWHGPRLRARRHLYGEDVRNGLLQGQFILAEHYVGALRLAELKRLELEHSFEAVDFMMTPTTPIIAPIRGTRMAMISGVEEPVGNALSRYTCLFNLTGHPALALPIGRHSTGLPIGLQIIGKTLAERTLLRLGHVLEMTGIAGWIPPSVTP